MIEFRSSDIVLTPEALRQRITDHDIFKYYCPPFEKLGKKFRSELRTDPVASAVISELHVGLRYKDFGYPAHSFDSIDYVKYKYALSFMDALKLIDNDFRTGLGSRSSAPFTMSSAGSITGHVQRPKVESIIHIRSRDLNWNDKVFWEQFGIDAECLKLFSVVPITHYWINGTRFEADKFTYAYCEHAPRYKIYSPNSKEWKWVGNTGMSDIQGIGMLPVSGEDAVITSSLKDVMTLFQVGIPSVAPQGEGYMISDDVAGMLSHRFKNVHVFYDNDFRSLENPGQTMALRICEKFKYSNMVIPEHYGCKDPSDLVKAHGIHPLIHLIQHAFQKKKDKE